MLISIVEYATMHGKNASSVRVMAARGRFSTAQKIGRNWVIDSAETYPDNRIKEDGAMRTYCCVVTSNSTHEREYEVNTTSAIKAAQIHGRAEGGEIVRVYSKSGKLISEARWSPEGHYYRCTI